MDFHVLAFLSPNKHKPIEIEEQSVATSDGLLFWYVTYYEAYFTVAPFFFFFEGHLKGNITLVKNLHFLFLMLLTATTKKKSVFMSCSSSKIKTLIYQIERKRGAAFYSLMPKKTFLFSEPLLLWQRDGFQAGKRPRDPWENKTLWTVSWFFQLDARSAAELYIRVTSETRWTLPPPFWKLAKWIISHTVQTLLGRLRAFKLEQSDFSL